MSRRMPIELCRVDIPEDKCFIARARVAPIVRHRADSFNAYQSVHQQIESIALDCYTQGLIDGAQVGAKHGIR